MILMAKRVSFWARKPVKVPTKVCFKTSEGKNVCFTAKKIIKKPVSINFFIKKRRK